MSISFKDKSKTSILDLKKILSPEIGRILAKDYWDIYHKKYEVDFYADLPQDKKGPKQKTKKRMPILEYGFVNKLEEDPLDYTSDSEEHSVEIKDKSEKKPKTLYEKYLHKKYEKEQLIEEKKIKKFLDDRENANKKFTNEKSNKILKKRKNQNLNKPIYMRLDEIEEQKLKNMEKIKQKIKNEEKEKRSATPDYKQNYSSNGSNNPNHFKYWIASNKRWEQNRKDKIQEQINEKEEVEENDSSLLFIPQIDENSRKIFEKKNTNPNLDCGQRLFNYQEIYKKNRESLDQQYKPSFKPSINTYDPNNRNVDFTFVEDDFPY